MKKQLKSTLAIALAALALAAPAEAAGLKKIAEIAIPGAPISAFGTIYIDQGTGRGYLADKDNKAIDVIDTDTDRYLTRITGFVGTGKSGDTSGPNGFLTVGGEGWSGDGDSTVKVIDLKSGTITDTIATGGNRRIGELAYDSKNHIVIAANQNDQIPFLTLISTAKGHKILARIPVRGAINGLERSAYYAPKGKFYTDLPELDGAKGRGALAEIDPVAGKLTRLIALDGCNAHSLAQVSASRFYVGCNASPDKPVGPMAVVDVEMGKLVALIPGLGGTGQTAANPKTGQYYAATGNPDGSTLTIVDIKTTTLVQKIPEAYASHSLAVSLRNNHVYLPTIAKDGPCGGCILVYAPE